ncbi:MAG: presqualene diphosphate synthase HpnD [Gammaproteobacteria bacterium]|nr:presqualene diphosphate synthase HpnD [Gammaproteobacteria bacterium]
MTPDEYCQDVTARSRSSFYYSFLFLPTQRRKALTAVYAFCREVDDVVDECKEEAIARIKLAWWREDIKQAFQGQAQHPVNQAIAHYKESFNLPLEYFLEIIDGMEMDLNQQRYADFKELSLYCYRVASAVGLLAVEIFGYRNRLTLKYAHNLGMAFQLTNILRDVKEDAARGRLYIPEDELARFNVTVADITQGIHNENTRALFSFQAQRAEDYYNQAFAQLPEEDRYAQRSGLIMAAVYRNLLEQIRKQDFNVTSQRVSLSALKKIWLAYQTARREKLRYLRSQATVQA